jgi:hypothetical protein
MDRLPPELHHQVCGYLPRKDLPNYRLVNKQFSDIASPVLFHQLVFYANSASFDRIHAVAAHPVFWKHVRTLIWDANTWDLGDDVASLQDFRNCLEIYAGGTFEFELYTAKQKGVDMLHLATYSQADIDFEIERQHVLYTERIAEELNTLKLRLRTEKLKPVLARFRQLNEVKILNGQYELTHGKTAKKWPSYFHSVGPVPPRAYLQLFARGEGTWREDRTMRLPGQYAFEQVIKALSYHTSRLELDHLS